MKDNTSAIIAVFSVVLIINGMVSLYVTSNVIIFSSTAQIYPPIQVIYSEFNASTTNFSAFDEPGLQNIINLTLEVSDYGKVVFDGSTDLTQDKDKYNNISIDDNAEFFFNSLSINTGILTSLKKSASVWIYNLTLINPQVYVDGYFCPPTLCTVIDYTNGTLVFRVSQFSYSYSAFEVQEEEPSEGGRPSPAIIPFSNFSVSREFIKAVVKQGETFLDSIEIKNNGNTNLNFTLTVDGMEEWVAVSEQSFFLPAGKSKRVTVAFTVPENGKADVMTGRLLVNAGGKQHAVLLIMEAKKKQPLFDIFLSLEDTPMEVVRGEEVSSEIFLYNFGDPMSVDVKLYYSLRDFDGNEILFKYDTLAVDEQAKIIRNIRLPDDIEEGYYVFYARIEYDNQTASSSGLIRVVKEKTAPALLISPEATAYTLLSIAAIILAAFIIRKGKYRTLPGRIKDSINLGFFRKTKDVYKEPEDANLGKIKAEINAREKKERHIRSELMKKIRQARR